MEILSKMIAYFNVIFGSISQHQFLKLSKSFVKQSGFLCVGKCLPEKGWKNIFWQNIFQKHVSSCRPFAPILNAVKKSRPKMFSHHFSIHKNKQKNNNQNKKNLKTCCFNTKKEKNQRACCYG